MHDGVAEILSERSRSGESTAMPVVLSLALHGILILLLVTAARRAPLETLRPSLNVRLAPLAARRASGSPRPVVKPSEKPPAELPTAAVDPVKPQPVAAPVQPPAAKPNPLAPATETLFGRAKGEPAPRKAVMTPPAPVAGRSAGESAAPLPAIGAAGVTSLDGGEFAYPLYINRMIALIGSRWFRPQGGGEFLARVYFLIQRDGTIRDAKIESESGNSTFDRAALRSVIESSPLPPLPFAYSGTELGVHLAFH